MDFQGLTELLTLFTFTVIIIALGFLSHQAKLLVVGFRNAKKAIELVDANLAKQVSQLGIFSERLSNFSRTAEKASEMAMEAKIAAQGLEKSTVIQRVVERYHPTPEASASSKTVEEMNELFDEFAQGNNPHTVDGKLYKPPTDILPEDSV